jgi:prepilin-type N-terminal cleavage/methylation domain-containing protein
VVRHAARRGLSLVEVLVALAIFGIIVGLAGSGIIQALRLQSLNEAATTLQAKLRRVTEVVAQDLRSSVFGGLANVPYASGPTSLSFALAEGPQGYQVLPSGGGSFPNSANVDVFAPVAQAVDVALEGRRALMVNGAGEAIVFTVTNVQATGGPNNARWNVVHAGCNNTIAYVEPVRLFGVESTGFSFDAASGELRRRAVGGAERVVAFGLSDFDLAFVYAAGDGSTLVRTEPFMAGTVPVRIAEVAGVDYRLQSLRVTVAAETQISGRTVVREYVSQVQLPDGGSVDLRSVEACP